MAVPIFFKRKNQPDRYYFITFNRQNFHCNVTSTRKQNNGNRKLTGIVNVAGSLAYILDSDGVDNLIAVPELTPFTTQVQAL